MHQPYFLGITLPADLQQAISRWQDELIDQKTMRQPLTPHITLIHPEVLSTISPTVTAERARSVADRFLPLNITLTHIASFGRSVLYVEVDDNPQLNGLHQAVVSSLPQNLQNAYFVGRTFTPHVTLLQAQPGNKLEPGLDRELIDRFHGFLPVSFEVTALSLFLWQSPRKYRIEEIN